MRGSGGTRKSTKAIGGTKVTESIQVSPPNEHRIINGDHPDGEHVVYPWWQRYQPVSYLMGSRSGTEEEFTDMVQRCNDVGIR